MSEVTHYTTEEGGAWIEWAPATQFSPQASQGDVFAIKLADGRIWDKLVGWRGMPEENPSDW